ncbi:DUF4263 domain-containing protein [Chenggangzhangella methanolivorans]|uniref:DUF4263 domain-containing protein n=1 Tax=Chenggangzhangella methanolivorans TaxID=1437009 RepID=A0A9E6RBW3_9HYPH|nr:DUF4263 domain-containing protein [Chenggangzhangella methanolivorans]QZO01020.1 DUF4263 domain-containing protein [Chenggangzhangella methanolivorans]
MDESDKDKFDRDLTIWPTVNGFLEALAKRYWGPLRKKVEADPRLRGSVTGFLVNFKEIAVYVGRTHIAIEYLGSELFDEMPDGINMNVKCFDLIDDKGNLLEKIIGFGSDSTVDFELKMPTFSQDYIWPTNRGHDKLYELGWNFAAQESIISLNAPKPVLEPGHFCRIVNGRFFDANDAGLITRHIKWLDALPISIEDRDDDYYNIKLNLGPLNKLVEHDADYRYPLPTEYKYRKLPIINRFIEIWGNRENRETKITSFIAQDENKFLITMRFGAADAHSELTCEWQSESKPPIKPDFFVVQPNGFADIVEFKLPYISSKGVVGELNRESFASWLNSYISQTRVYASYFDDPNNRRWFENRYGFSVLKPRRWLVVGRRSDFTPQMWREIASDYRDLEIMNFDDLVDGVSIQFYK